MACAKYHSLSILPQNLGKAITNNEAGQETGRFAVPACISFRIASPSRIEFLFCHGILLMLMNELSLTEEYYGPTSDRAATKRPWTLRMGRQAQDNSGAALTD